MTIKLVAMDIDGTILNSRHEITENVNQAIQQARQAGVCIALATGRPAAGTTAQIKALKLDSERDFILSYNGSLIQNLKSDTVIAEYGITYEDYLEVEMFSRKAGVHLHVIDHENIYTANRDISRFTILETYLLQMPLKYRTTEEMSRDLSIIKCMMIDEPEIISRIITEVPPSFKDRFSMVRSTDFYFEIQNKHASKGRALQTLAAHLGIPQEETLAIGDNENDLSMIEAAGIGIAMGNGTDSLKKAADFTVSSNDEDGVAEAIQRFVL